VKKRHHVNLEATQAPPEMDPTESRVGRTMAAGMPGTVRLVERFGDALVVVRYRYDWTGLYRFTTVELLVETARVTRGPVLSRSFAVRLKKDEGELIRQSRALGARWNPGLLCWVMPGRAVQLLNLAKRVEWAQLGERLSLTQRFPRTRR
jgi:hypothetical protein